MTAMMSASRIVDILCAMTSTVLPFKLSSSAFWTMDSELASKADVASSNKIKSASRYNALAKATRWR